MLKNLGVVCSTPAASKGRNLALSAVGANNNGEQFELCPSFQSEDALEGLIDRISVLRKQPPVIKAGSRRNMIADIPILAKLTPVVLDAKF